MKKLILLVLVLIAVAGCKHASDFRHPIESLGHYKEATVSDRVITLSVVHNSNVSSERVSDLLVSRAAQLTLEGGYKTFAAYRSQADLKAKTPWKIGARLTGPGHRAELVVEMGKPGFKASRIVKKMAKKYRVRPAVASDKSTRKASKRRKKGGFVIASGYETLPASSFPVKFFGHTQNISKFGFPIGIYSAKKSKDVTAMKKKLVDMALATPGRYVKLYKTAAESKMVAPKSRWAAELYYVPLVGLGVQLDSAQLSDNKLVVTGFADYSIAKRRGVRAGDRLLAVDGKVLDRAADYYLAWAGWKAGQTIKLEVLRKGTIKVVTIRLR